MSKLFLLIDNTKAPSLLFVSKTQYRQLAASVCALLHIPPEGAHLVPLLDGNTSLTNTGAIANWCQRQLSDIELHAQRSPASLAEKLAERLQSHLMQFQP